MDIEELDGTSKTAVSANTYGDSTEAQRISEPPPEFDKDMAPIEK